MSGCTYVYQRGPKKGSVCGTKLSCVSKSRGLCGVHSEDTRSKGIITVTKRAKEASERKYLVTVDNSTGIFKKADKGVITREVREARALQLQRQGATIELITTK
jgi:hypothetical protein